MSYLITQTFMLLLIAALLGLVLGWYLTRIAAAGGRAALQARLRNVEIDARELRAELDAASRARAACETDRRVLGDELNDLRARQGDAGVDVAALRGELSDCRAALADAEAERVSAADHAALQAELAECRSALEALSAPPAVSEREVDTAAIASAASAAALGARELIGGALAPRATPAPDAAADDLQQIKGIGPKIAGTLKDLGILRFEQIAAWTPENIEWVSGHLKFKGRIEREQWIPQAKALLADRERSG